MNNNLVRAAVAGVGLCLSSGCNLFEELERQDAAIEALRKRPLILEIHSGGNIIYRSRVSGLTYLANSARDTYVWNDLCRSGAKVTRDTGSMDSYIRLPDDNRTCAQLALTEK